MRLNLGCGKRKLDGYVNVDVRKDADLVCDVRELPEELFGKADEILAVHLIEHFTYYDAPRVLLHWRQVLKPGGRIILECPNLQEACLSFLADPERVMFGMNCIYGEPQPDGNIWQLHKWGYTPKSLMGLLEYCGYTQVKQTPAQFKQREPRDMRVEAIKP